MTDVFPNDENGDVLRRMAADGDNLSKERPIDFSVIFKDEASARRFVEYFARLDCRSVLHPEKVRGGNYFDVTISKVMLPTHVGITSFESELERVAMPLGGQNDGWGCFPQS